MVMDIDNKLGGFFAGDDVNITLKDGEVIIGQITDIGVNCLELYNRSESIDFKDIKNIGRLFVCRR